MAIIGVDTAMRLFPGLAVSAMTACGTCVDNNDGNPGIIIDIVDAVKDPDRLYFVDPTGEDNWLTENEIVNDELELADGNLDIDEESEQAVEINPNGIKREETIRDLLYRYSREAEAEVSAEELITRFALQQKSKNPQRLKKVSLRTSTKPEIVVEARVAILEERPKQVKKLKKPFSREVRKNIEASVKAKKTRKKSKGK